MKSNSITAKDIRDLTDLWVKEVTENNNPTAVYELFCPDGNLVGTVSQIERRGENIRGYFDYFAKLPGVKALSKEYNINKVTEDVHINTAFITWTWDDLKEPIVARMTFVYRNERIFQLHSSTLPSLNKELLRISGSP